MIERVEHLAEGVSLYLGDSRKILPPRAPGVAIVTDPPYGIAHVKGAGGKGAHSRRNIEAIIGDDGPFDPAPWLTFDHVIMFGADHFYPRLPDRGRWLVFDKLDGMEPWDSFSDVEFAWCSTEGAARMFSLRWKGIACVKAHEGYGVREHPTQKPVALMDWCIKQLPATCTLICDPFCGSGTTGVAAVNLGRKFTGIEIHEPYFDIACRRVAAALARPDLFIEKPARADKDKPTDHGSLFGGGA